MTLKDYKSSIMLDGRSEKLNFNIDGRNHFVYRITHIIRKLHYYGSKTGELSVLGESYISSSTDLEFIKDQKKNPQDYKYKVIRVFDTPADKMIFESYLHQKFNVKEENNSFYNKANQTPFGFDTTGKTFIFTEEHRRKLSKAREGILHTEESKKKISEANKGKKRTTETKNQLSLSHMGIIPWNKGVSHKNETKEKMSLSHYKILKVKCPHCDKIGKPAPMKRWHFDNCGKSIKQKIVTCPHCGKEGGNNNMKRWHFDNCKYKPTVISPY